MGKPVPQGPLTVDGWVRIQAHREGDDGMGRIELDPQRGHAEVIVVGRQTPGLIRSYPEACGLAGFRQPRSASKPLMSWDRAASPSVIDQNPSSRSAFIARLLIVAMI